jgi:hypothetical protein
MATIQNNIPTKPVLSKPDMLRPLDFSPFRHRGCFPAAVHSPRNPEPYAGDLGNLFDDLFHFIEIIVNTSIGRTRISTAKLWSLSKVRLERVEYISAGIAGSAQSRTDAWF